MGLCQALGTFLESSTVPGCQMILSKTGMKYDCRGDTGAVCASDVTEHSTAWCSVPGLAVEAGLWLAQGSDQN